MLNKGTFAHRLQLTLAITRIEAQKMDLFERPYPTKVSIKIQLQVDFDFKNKLFYYKGIYLNCGTRHREETVEFKYTLLENGPGKDQSTAWSKMV